MRAERGVALALAFFLIAVVGESVLRTGNDPLQTDFGNYFASARMLVVEGDTSGIYDRETFLAAMERAGVSRLGSFVPQPPTNALWLSPLVRWDAKSAKTLWTLILILASVGCALALRSLYPATDVAFLILGFVAPIDALRNGVAFGQPYVLVSLLLVLGVLSMEKGWPKFGAFALGLSAAFKPQTTLVALLFVYPTWRRFLPAFLAGATTPVSLVGVLAGWGSFRDYLQQIVPRMALGEIQDPYSWIWGSGSALFRSLLTYERDLNPAPLVVAPQLAQWLATFFGVALAGIGVGTAWHAQREGKVGAAVACVVSFSLAASPFGASYHLALLWLPLTFVASRASSRAKWQVLLLAFAAGSPLVHAFSDATRYPRVLGFLRVFLLIAIAFEVARPFLSRGAVRGALLIAIGAASLLSLRRTERETWDRVDDARGYLLASPHFCSGHLGWWSSASTGLTMVVHSASPSFLPCEGSRSRTGDIRRSSDGAWEVTSRFESGSWNIYVRKAQEVARWQRLTFSNANEVEPVWVPDSRRIVFASDQDRGLGSTALYSVDLSQALLR